MAFDDEKGDLVIQILDMGQGEAIYIEFPNGKNMMVDFGSTKGAGGYKVAPKDALTYLGKHSILGSTARLDYLVVTHPDADHHNLVHRLVGELKVTIGTIMYGGASKEYTRGTSNKDDVWTFGNLIDEAKKRGIEVLQPPHKLPFAWGHVLDFDDESRNKPLLFGGAEIVIAAVNTVPVTRKGEKSWQRNTPSLVMVLHYHGGMVMPTGDATHDTEARILADFEAKKRMDWIKCDVLKLPHHGSTRTSNAPDFITAVNPNWVFVSSDRYGTADPEKDKFTMYRLPQEITFDIVRQYASLDKVKRHPYVSYYDPRDYKEYKDPFRGRKKHPAQVKHDISQKLGLADFQKVVGKAAQWMGDDGKPAQWMMQWTEEGIFTTLAYMDAKQKGVDGSVADEGLQFEIRLSKTSKKLFTLTATQFKDNNENQVQIV